MGIGVDLSMNATRQDQLDLIEPSSPGEPAVVNPELGEMRRPEWASQFGVGLSYGPYSLSWSGVYYDEMTLGYEDGGEIETIEQNYGGAGVADARLIQDIRGAWQASDALTVYGGVSNLTNRQPYVSEFGYPVSPRGAYFFMGVTYNGAAR